MTVNPDHPSPTSNPSAAPALVVECDRTWRFQPLQNRQPSANPLASALLGFLQLPIVQILGPACITGYDRSHSVRPHLVGLTDVQQRGFSRTLTTLLAMPDYLALHAQACRISASWART